jgi:hypothetical protein
MDAKTFLKYLNKKTLPADNLSQDKEYSPEGAEPI